MRSSGPLREISEESHGAINICIGAESNSIRESAMFLHRLNHVAETKDASHSISRVCSERRRYVDAGHWKGLCRTEGSFPR